MYLNLPVLSHSGDPAHPRVLEPGPVAQLAHRCSFQRRVEMCHLHARINIALRKVCKYDAVPDSVVMIRLDTVSSFCSFVNFYILQKWTYT